MAILELSGVSRAAEAKTMHWPGFRIWMLLIAVAVTAIALGSLQHAQRSKRGVIYRARAESFLLRAQSCRERANAIKRDCGVYSRAMKELSDARWQALETEYDQHRSGELVLC